MHIFWRLTVQEIKTLLQKWQVTVLGALVWASVFITINGFMLPAMGIAKTYGGFMLVMAFFQSGLFETLGNAQILIGDLFRTNRIQYELTLPIDARLVFIKFAVAFAAQVACLYGWILPLGKLALGERLDFSHTIWWQFGIMYVLGCWFLGCLGLWLAAAVQHPNKFTVFRGAILGPLWMLGCQAYPFKIAWNYSTAFGYALLMNPFTYIHEGIRAAAFADQGFIPFYVCAPITLITSTLLLAHALYLFKQRLDYI